MLSEEEKKAINNLNFIIVTDIYDNEVRINKTEIVNEYNHSVGIVLNLITKLQKENEEKDDNIAKLNEYLERISQDLDNVAIDQIPIAIVELKYKNQLKDKQIDLMVEKIYKRISAKELNKYCNKKNNCKNYEECFNCIKQYYETKVKEENSINKDWLQKCDKTI